MNNEYDISGTQQHICAKKNCYFCYEIKRLELLKNPKPDFKLKEGILKRHKGYRPDSVGRASLKWKPEDRILLLSLIDIPSKDIIKQEVFKRRTVIAIDKQKYRLRKQHNIKPKERNMRIYHL